MCAGGGGIIFRTRVINIVFGPKHRPLHGELYICRLAINRILAFLLLSACLSNYSTSTYFQTNPCGNFISYNRKIQKKRW
jgi:hypothetical protein